MNMEELSRLLNTSFARSIRKPFMKAVNEHGMVSNGDNIAVCVSGGKDSMLLSLLMKELQRFVDFQLVFISMDPGFPDDVRNRLEINAAAFGIELRIFKTDVLKIAQNHASKHPCFLCSKMRRGYLYSEAQKHGCNKIALGHHYDDAVETALMGFLYGGQIQPLRPKLKSQHFENMELIRPLCFVRQYDINRFVEKTGLDFPSCGCGLYKPDSYREKVRKLIAYLDADNKQVKANILNAVKKL